MRTIVCAGLLLAALAAPADAQESKADERAAAGRGADTASPEYVRPYFKDAGGIVRLPGAVEQPRKGSKVVLDFKASGALGRAALIGNQYADAGFKPGEDFQIALVLHGEATKAALGDDAYAAHTGSVKNPHSGLIKALIDGGAEVYVCGQALAHHHYGMDEILPGVKVAASAATVNINKQLDGYAYIPFH